MKKVTRLMLVSALLLSLYGCCPVCKKPAPVAAKPAPAPQAAPAQQAAPAPAPTGACGAYTLSNTYPNSGAVRLTNTMPQEVMANKTFSYTIEVANLTDMVLGNVVVTDYLDQGVKFQSAAPEAKLDGNACVWKMDTLGPKAVQKLAVTATAVDSGCLKTCAKVTYDLMTCAYTSVVSPVLKLTKEAPAEVTLCDAIPVKLTVTNTGTGVTRNVIINDTLPEGLTVDGKREVSIPAGNLEAKQSKTFTITAKAQKTGTYTNKATAQAEGDLKTESAETKTVVRQPVLALTKTAPGERFVGREIDYEITVTNNGDGPAANTVIKDVVPAGVTFVKASNGGTFATGNVTWNIGTLAPNTSKKVTVTYMPGGIGEVSNRAVATAVCAKEATATAKTTVSGIAAVLLEVIDVADPIEVGKDETYEIVVTNQGSAADTNIVIKCVFEEQMQYVSSSGPTTGTLEGSTLTFKPLASLAPKAKAVWKVQAKALKPADVRFRVTLDTDQIDRNVEETESTHLYQ